jgi:uncharacterized membrane protein YphA (DoxX/SURF4 family)
MSDRPSHGWPPALRLAFRAAFIFYAAWTIPHLAAALPILRTAVRPLFRLEYRMGVLLTQHVLRWPPPTGEYSDEFPPLAFEIALAVLSLIAAVVWSALDRRAREYRRLSSWLYVLVRFALAMEMVAYGLSKIFPVQFEGRVNLVALATPLGFLTPHALLWAFMGSSRAYTIFTGIGEFVGAVLVCFRRTALAGALLLVAVLANVFVMNVAYDIDVKVGSANLLAMAILVAAYDGRRLSDFFLSRRAADVSRLPPLFTSPRANRIAGTVGSAGVVLLFSTNSMRHEMLPEMRENGPSAPTPALFGIYDVEQMTRNGESTMPMSTDNTFWHRIVFERFGRTVAFTPGGTAVVFAVKVDSVAKMVELRELARGDGMSTGGAGDKAPRFDFHYSMPDSQHLALRGTTGIDSLTVLLRHVEASRYLLTAHRWGGWGGW